MRTTLCEIRLFNHASQKHDTPYKLNGKSRSELFFDHFLKGKKLFGPDRKGMDSLVISFNKKYCIKKRVSVRLILVMASCNWVFP
jgi:hypothetical protein